MIHNDNYKSSNPDPPHNTSDKLVFKLYFPEEARLSEPEILAKVYEIAKDDLRVIGHVPDMVWFHRFHETSTTNIRMALGMKDAKRGSRIFYIIVFRKLEPITNLSETEFRKAWRQIFICKYPFFVSRLSSINCNSRSSYPLGRWHLSP